MVVIVRYSEIGLKGENRIKFENRLIENIKDCLNKNYVEFDRMVRKRGRIIVYTKEYCDCLRYVFGIKSFSPAIETCLNIEEIKRNAVKFYTGGTFRITTKRLEKIFLTSQKINEIVGDYIRKNKRAKVDLKSPDVEIGIEIFNGKAYIFNQKIKGPGGLPIGVSGKVALILDNEKAVDAGILLMKRGCEIVVVEKKKIDFKRMEKFCYGFKLKIKKNVPKNIIAICVSDDLKNIKKWKYKKLILRPLATDLNFLDSRLLK